MTFDGNGVHLNNPLVKSNFIRSSCPKKCGLEESYVGEVVCQCEDGKRRNNAFCLPVSCKKENDSDECKAPPGLLCKATRPCASISDIGGAFVFVDAKSSVADDAQNSVAVAGSMSQVAGKYSTLVAGMSNTISSCDRSLTCQHKNYGTILGGFRNTVEANLGTVLGGASNAATGLKSFAAGFGAAAAGEFSADLLFSSERTQLAGNKVDGTVQLAADKIQLARFGVEMVNTLLASSKTAYEPFVERTFFEIDESTRQLEEMTASLKSLSSMLNKEVENLHSSAKVVLSPKNLRTLYMPWLRQVARKSK